MAFVLDCSVTMAWIFPDEATDATDRLRDTLVETRAFVPGLWPIETANALLVATRRGRIVQGEWPRIRSHLDALPLATLDQALRAAGQAAGVDVPAVT